MMAEKQDPVFPEFDAAKHTLRPSTMECPSCAYEFPKNEVYALLGLPVFPGSEEVKHVCSWECMANILRPLLAYGTKAKSEPHEIANDDYVWMHVDNDVSPHPITVSYEGDVPELLKKANASIRITVHPAPEED